MVVPRVGGGDRAALRIAAGDRGARLPTVVLDRGGDDRGRPPRMGRAEGGGDLCLYRPTEDPVVDLGGGPELRATGL